MNPDTIYAVSSGLGRGGVAVIRVSGACALKGLEILTRRKVPTPRVVKYSKLYHPVSCGTLDNALYFCFQSPESYTGEDVVEYHVHGGKAVIDAVLEALSILPQHRMAQAGEFTRRAFENGKIDLTEAEAIADLIDAQTQMQKDQALVQMEGALSRLYKGWSDALSRLLAYIEADIEFPDEDMPEGVFQQALPALATLSAEIQAHLRDNRRGERLRGGIHIAIIGAPNAGKSSLLNVLAQRDAAIVSNVAGTTRDMIEVHLDLGGYPVILVDTAGLRAQEDFQQNPLLGSDLQNHNTIEAEGIRRAKQRAMSADITLCLYDGTLPAPDMETFALEGKLKQEAGHVIPLINKADQGVRLRHPDAPLEISVKDNAGIDTLLETLVASIKNLLGQSETPAITRARHRQALEACAVSLNRALSAPLPELIAEDVRLAIRDLGRITGKVDVEDLLDIVFRDFCIGK